MRILEGGMFTNSPALRLPYRSNLPNLLVREPKEGWSATDDNAPISRSPGANNQHQVRVKCRQPFSIRQITAERHRWSTGVRSVSVPSRSTSLAKEIRFPTENFRADLTTIPPTSEFTILAR